MSSFIHQALRSWRRDVNLPYFSSIMIANKGIPLLNTAAHDYEWLLAVTKDRLCKEVEPVVKRYIDGHNLSLDPVYREEDFRIMMDVLREYGATAGIKRLCATRAKYFYKMGRYGQARKYFLRAQWSGKNLMYIFTSFVPPLARWIVKRYVVFG